MKMQSATRRKCFIRIIMDLNYFYSSLSIFKVTDKMWVHFRYFLAGLQPIIYMLITHKSALYLAGQFTFAAHTSVYC